MDSSLQGLRSLRLDDPCNDPPIPKLRNGVVVKRWVLRVSAAASRATSKSACRGIATASVFGGKTERYILQTFPKFFGQKYAKTFIFSVNKQIIVPFSFVTPAIVRLDVMDLPATSPLVPVSFVGRAPWNVMRATAEAERTPANPLLDS